MWRRVLTDISVNRLHGILRTWHHHLHVHERRAADSDQRLRELSRTVTSGVGVQLHDVPRCLARGDRWKRSIAAGSCHRAARCDVSGVQWKSRAEIPDSVRLGGQQPRSRMTTRKERSMWRCVERLVGCSLAVVATVSVASAQEAGAEERVAVSLDRAVAVAAAGATFDETQTSPPPRAFEYSDAYR